MKLRVALACAAIAAVTLVGCAGPEEPTEPSASPSASTPQPSPSASPKPSGPPPLSCNTMITQETIDGFEAAGYVHEVDYESDIRSDGSIQALFFDYGGLVCMWYLPNSDGWFTAGYSEITEAEAVNAQARLEAEGFIRTDEGTDVRYTIDPSVDLLGHNDTYLFEAGAWYHSSDPNGIAEVRTVIAERG
jgi:hypothetical protein